MPAVVWRGRVHYDPMTSAIPGSSGHAGHPARKKTTARLGWTPRAAISGFRKGALAQPSDAGLVLWLVQSNNGWVTVDQEWVALLEAKVAERASLRRRHLSPGAPLHGDHFRETGLDAVHLERGHDDPEERQQVGHSPPTDAGDCNPAAGRKPRSLGPSVAGFQGRRY